MGLLGSLGLPPIVGPTVSPSQTAPVHNKQAPPQVPEAPLLKSTITLVNASPRELTFVKSALDFPTAKFEPLVPVSIPANGGKVLFRVVEPTIGPKKTAGMAWFSYPGKKGKVDVIFAWSGKKAEVKVIGDGTFTRQTRAVEDLDRGNEYRMLFKEGKADAGEMLPPMEDPDAPPEQPVADGKPNPPAKVTIVNESGFGMTLGSSELKQQATFKSQPPKTVDGGRTGHFEVQSGTPDWPATAGKVTYTFTADDPADPNAPGVVQTANFEWEGNNWTGGLNPGAEDFKVVVDGGTDNYRFTLVGPKLEFAPPAEAKEPTLRKGDKSGDAWVEYLQTALNYHINAGLEVDGDFGGRTLKAVKAFQRKYKKEGVLEDGIVGDQTWSYLREGAPAKPKTDGRKPHSYVEKGAEARWFKEKDWVIYDYGGDALLMMALSLGDVALVENRKVRFRVVNPAGVQKVLDRPVGPAITETKDQRVHMVAIQQFSTLFDEAHTGNAEGGDYQVTAYLPADLGGDTYTGVLNIMGDGAEPPRSS